MIWLFFTLALLVSSFLILRYLVHRPLTAAALTQYDLPKQPLYFDKKASQPHTYLEQYLIQSEMKLAKLPQKERLAALRQNLDDGGIRITPSATITKVNTKSGINGEWVVDPKAKATTRILYIHGGAFYMGSPQSHRIITCKFSKIAQAEVFALDYRLRPEHPRLASFKDCKEAYLWLLENGANGKSKAKDIIIAGDSAGGNLTLALLTWIRDKKLPQPQAAICLSPVTDSTLSSPSIVKNLDKDAMLKSGLKALLSFSKTNLLIGGWLDNKVRLTDPRISPLFADLSNLPATFIQVSDSECLEDDARRYTNKARVAGSEVTLQVWANMMHVWHTFEPELDEAKAAFSEIEKFINQLKMP